MIISVRLFGRKIVSIAQGASWEPFEKPGVMVFHLWHKYKNVPGMGHPARFSWDETRKSRFPSARLKGAAPMAFPKVELRYCH
jgi:hypothetical protein